MEKYVKIINIVDRSSSMNSMIDVAINGFNEFIEEQKRVDGNALVTTILFNNKYDVLYEDVDIKNCMYFDKDNYKPQYQTALYDCICSVISNEIDKLGGMPIEERPEKTLCIILTDGFENASKKYSQYDVKTMISEMREHFKWEFIFLAADEQASTTAQSIGISIGNSYTFANTSDGLSDAYRGISVSSKVYRMSNLSKMDNLMDEYSKDKKG